MLDLPDKPTLFNKLLIIFEIMCIHSSPTKMGKKCQNANFLAPNPGRFCLIFWVGGGEVERRGGGAGAVDHFRLN